MKSRLEVVLKGDIALTDVRFGVVLFRLQVGVWSGPSVADRASSECKKCPSWRCVTFDIIFVSTTIKQTKKIIFSQ